MTYQQVLENARTCIGPYCKACNDCNGKVCRNTMPGPGAKGEGTGFIRNAEKWREICVNMDTICENSPVDTSFTLFGRTFEIPAFAAPVGAMRLHYGDKYDDLTYNDILVRACANAGILAFTGDGTDPKVVEGAAAALKGNGATVAVRLAEWQEKVHAVNPAAQDAAFLTNHDMGRAAGPLRLGLAQEKAAAMLYLLLPGRPTVYYGEELGMTGSGRDENKRLPMLWSAEDTAQLCNAPADADQNQRLKAGVDVQDTDADSLLNC